VLSGKYQGFKGLEFWLTFDKLTAMTTNRAFLEAALFGYQHQCDEIKMKMAEIRSILGGKSPAAAAHPAEIEDAPVKKRTMSAAGRKRIAAAQRKRWAAQKTAAPAPAKKRHMSAAGRKRIAEAAKKRWAALRAEKAAAQ